MKMKQTQVPFFVLGFLFLVWAAFMKFALIGYGVSALVLAGVGLVIWLYTFLHKKPRIVLTVLLVIFAAVFTTAEIPVVRASAGTPGAEADYLIVLGAGVNGSVPSLSMVNRLTAARDYLNAHPACIAIVTGGQGTGEDITEARAMTDWLTEQGIDPSRIIAEERATSTAENLEFSFALIPDAANARIAVCSSEYHLYRAEQMAEKLGYSVSGVPGTTTKPVLMVNYFIREGFGVIYMTLFGT